MSDARIVRNSVESLPEKFRIPIILHYTEESGRAEFIVEKLVFSYTLPTTGRVRDFHPLDCAHAGRTISGRQGAILGGCYR
jgi:hypothetical protein